jgi:hypothetical protein
MTTTRCKLGDGTPLTPEAVARLNALANLPDDEINFTDPDNPKATDVELACSVRVSDYPSLADAHKEIDHLMEMHRNGMSLDEIRAYKKTRAQTRQLTSV